MTVKSNRWPRPTRLLCFFAAMCTLVLLTALAVWFYAFSSAPASGTGWTAEEKEAATEYARTCPQSDCTAAYWHPELRSMIVEVRPGLTQGSTVVAPELSPYLRMNVVHEGILPEKVKKSLLSLPEHASDIPLIQVPDSSPPLTEDELLKQVNQCIPDTAGRGVNGYAVTVFIEGLVDGLAQGRSVDNFVTSSQRQCLGKISDLGYYFSFQEIEPTSLL